MKRLPLELPEKTRERLKNLKEATGAASDSEVLRRAIQAYDTITSGGVLVFIDKDGTETQVIIT